MHLQHAHNTHSSKMGDADVPLFKGDEEYPVDDPKNYSLARRGKAVDYVTLARYYMPHGPVKKGNVVVDTVKKKSGLCIKQGFVKGKQGTFCTLKGRGRNHHAAVENCVGTPAINTFVQDKDLFWHKLIVKGSSRATIYQCYGPLPAETESQKESTKCQKGA